MGFLEEKGRVIVEGVMEPLQLIMEEEAMVLLNPHPLMELHNNPHMELLNHSLIMPLNNLIIHLRQGMVFLRVQ